MVPPGARPQGSWQDGAERQGNAPWQANLPAMGVTADQHIEICMSGLPINLRCVRHEHRELLMRNAFCCLLDIVGSVEVGIINPHKMNVVPTPSDCLRLIHQHPDTHVF